MECTLQSCIGRFGIICLSELCGLSILPMAYQITTYTYPSNYTEAWIAYEYCLQSHEGYVLPSTVQASQVHAPLEISTQLQNNWFIKPTQPSSPTKHMAPSTLADLIVLGTCIITSAHIALERENILWKVGVPEEDGKRRECNDMEEAIAGPSSMNIDQSPSTHIPTTSITAMMIRQATMNLEHQGINWKPYKNYISKKSSLS